MMDFDFAMVKQVGLFAVVPALVGALVLPTAFDESNKDLFNGALLVSALVGGSLYLGSNPTMMNIRDSYLTWN